MFGSGSLLIRPLATPSDRGTIDGKHFTPRKLQSQPRSQLFIPEQSAVPATGETGFGAAGTSIELDGIDRSYRKVKKIVKHRRRYPAAPRRIKPGSAGWPHRKRRLNPHLFTPFTKWGPCDYYCHQKRERYCIAKRKCGNHIQTEERICPKNM